MITGLQTALNAKQPTLTAGTNITISGNTISSTGSSGATQSWVSANFLSPLNQGTVGVGPGLSASMTANTFLISVDQNFDRRNLFILQDANNVLRNITTNTSGNLLYDNVNLATEPYVTNALNNLTASNLIGNHQMFNLVVALQQALTIQREHFNWVLTLIRLQQFQQVILL